MPAPINKVSESRLLQTKGRFDNCIFIPIFERFKYEKRDYIWEFICVASASHLLFKSLQSLSALLNLPSQLRIHILRTLYQQRKARGRMSWQMPS